MTHPNSSTPLEDAAEANIHNMEPLPRLHARLLALLRDMSTKGEINGYTHVLTGNRPEDPERLFLVVMVDDSVVHLTTNLAPPK